MTCSGICYLDMYNVPTITDSSLVSSSIRFAEITVHGAIILLQRSFCRIVLTTVHSIGTDTPIIVQTLIQNPTVPVTFTGPVTGFTDEAGV